MNNGDPTFHRLLVSEDRRQQSPTGDSSLGYGADMAKCSVLGCTRPVAFGSKGLSRDAAILAAFFPVFDKALEWWPDQFPSQFFEFVNTGRGFFDLIHERVHGAPVQIPSRLIKDWKEAAGESCEGVAINDPRWFRDYWNEVEARGLKLPFGVYKLIRGKGALNPDAREDLPAWREEAKDVFDLLCGYASAVRQFQHAIDPAFDESSVGAQVSFAEVKPAHDKFYEALGVWIRRNAPGADNAGRKDPTGGGFAGLSVAFQDAYRANSLMYLALLGMTTYAETVAADGRGDEVVEAQDIAVDWYNDAMSFAQSIITTGEPSGSRFMSTYFDEVIKKHERAETAHGKLQPYLNGLRP